MKRKISTSSLAFFTLAAAGGLFLFSFFSGGFASSFSSNLCYAEVISEIRNSLEKAEKNNSMQEVKELNQKLSELKLDGFEASCGEMKATLNID